MTEQASALSNLYVVGFMGTGKSSISRRVARKLGMQFLDTDYEIEKAEGMPISQIFAEHGEAYFRKLEWEYVEQGHPSQGCVVSCGGGLVTQEGIADLMKSRGVLLCLYASVETILSRTRGNKKRPLLQVDDPEARIRELLAERQPYYSLAPVSVLTDQRSIPEVVEHVLRSYRTMTRSRS